MLDRVREALFSRTGEDVVDAVVLDLFAGSGSLALEALSRGAERARLVERGGAALKVLRANVALLGLEERVEVVRGDALAPASWGGPTEAFDLVFFDSPYGLLEGPGGRQAILTALAGLRERLTEGGEIVVHGPKGAWLPGDLQTVDERTYGTQGLWFLGSLAT